MRYVEHLKVNGPVTCLMSAILVCTMSISKALVHVKPTQCPHCMLLWPSYTDKLNSLCNPIGSQSGEAARSEPIARKLPALISHPQL